jgi:ornithine cyclodeaminase/alanine dehydrogenase-like protein (mu-crystallin family)
MLHITEDQVRQLLPMRECVSLMREVFRDLRTGAATPAAESSHRLDAP